jgi:hypothetical protein
MLKEYINTSAQTDCSLMSRQASEDTFFILFRQTGLPSFLVVFRLTHISSNSIKTYI